MHLKLMHLIFPLCHWDFALLCTPYPSCLWCLYIWFFGFVTWILDYSIDLILLAFSILCGGDFHLSRLYLFCFQYLMQRRVSPIKVHASDSLALSLELETTLQTSSILPLIFHTEEIFISGFIILTLDHAANFILPAFSNLCEGELSRAAHLVFWFCYLDFTLQTSSFLRWLSQMGEIMYQS